MHKYYIHYKVPNANPSYYYKTVLIHMYHYRTQNILSAK